MLLFSGLGSSSTGTSTAAIAACSAAVSDEVTSLPLASW
ncbi:Vmc-like lipoprotein signal peptide domain-containing protein [uncultured Bradyrhizobium sp.]